jgi:small subunit ribosomal protein S11
MATEEKPEKTEKTEKPERAEKVDKSEKPERPEREEKAGKAEAGAEAGAAEEGVKKKKKIKKNILNGVVHVQATFNNTLITITDVTGNVLAWSSAGSRGFKGSRKSTPFAAQVAAGDAAAKAMAHGLKNVTIRVNGPGAGRESALRAISASGLKVSEIRDVTPIPHNGCRPPKRRRV